MEQFKLPYKTQRSGDKAIIFIHGFLDAGQIWTPVIENVTCPGYEIVTLDLPGMGALSDWNGPLDLHTLADAVLTVVDAVNKPFVLVGHSMGCQIAELVAAARPQLAEGLVLLSPIPLAGLPCDQGVIDMMHVIGQNRELQLPVRHQFCPEMTDEQIEEHMKFGMLPTRENAATLFDAWSQGLPEGKEPSAFTGKVRVITGTNDPFAAPPIVEAGIAPRFRQFSMRVIDGASHWSQFTLGDVLGTDISEFVSNL